MNSTFSDAKAGATHSHRSFAYLDGLRGLAAIAVVLLHFASRTDLAWLFPHGYLAVDFFFVLSGFVLAHAYYQRVRAGRIGLRAMLVMRAIRLLPLVILGTVLAFVIETQRPDVVDHARHWQDMFAAFFMGSLLLPIWWTRTLEMVLFPLNLPMWSLFFEAVANVVAALMVAAGVGPRPVLALVAASAAVLVWAGLSLGGLDFGYAQETFWPGFARVFFSFFVGVLVCLGRVRITATPPLLSVAVFLLAIAAPEMGGSLDAVFDLLAVFVAFPLIVARLAAADPPGRFWTRICLTSGNLSYPIYALHYPVVRAIGVVIRGHEMSQGLQFAAAVAGTVLIVVFSWFAFRYFDVPVRAALTRRWLSQGTTRATPVPGKL